MTMHSPFRRQYASEEQEDQRILAKQKQTEEDRASKAQQAQKEADDSQRKWILQYMEQDASDGDSSHVSLLGHKFT